ncbi:inhibitor of KinA [Salinimicrobium catena]|uniref:Inhibitor of KinA n=1 Tax=Salinimicrobium catena TaxID=390640 RepID=A0A1H5LG41_9FLAO|nr:5-oxoprolinase subunit PxpB [Salinimicrobium catena]SDL09073.1 inhibitor of KinA [Salinimicrobium catena]SEE75341.1 inhibitor of KinA [Salinimicrobium catena]
MRYFPEIKPLGERGILIDFQPEISEQLLEKLLRLKIFLQKELLKEKVEVINTFSSLLINYPLAIEDVYNEVLKVKTLVEKANIHNKTEQQIFQIPVCYEEAFALDLELISQQKKISKEEIIRLHSAPIYTVYFIGFLPGFLYLGGLDKKLQFPRKEQPRMRVEKGAVGIGKNQTGIYPKTSPGGWQIIGNSPVPLFDKNKIPPCEISPGDKLKFYAIDLEEHERIQKEVDDGIFKFKNELYVG